MTPEKALKMLRLVLLLDESEKERRQVTRRVAESLTELLADDLREVATADAACAEVEKVNLN